MLADVHSSHKHLPEWFTHTPYVTQFWKTDQVVTNSISSNDDFKY